MIWTGDLSWRLTAKFESEKHAHGIFSVLKVHTSVALAADRLKHGLVVQHEAEWLRIYGPSYDALCRGQSIVAGVLELQGVIAEEQAERRLADAPGWQRVELPPLPERHASSVTEHHGKGPWGSEAEPTRVQVHFELDSKHAAQAFAKELAENGYDTHQVGSFVFIFADDAATAHDIGNALRSQAPAGAQLFFEGEGRTLFI